MNFETRLKLNKLNHKFYSTGAKYWNRNPDYFWTGWINCLPFIISKITNKKKIKVLDLGSGNCRFGNFLKQNLLGVEIDYHAVDNSEYLLAQGINNLSTSKNFAFSQLNIDLGKENWWQNPFFSDDYDLIVAFGILHHLPGQSYRYKFLENLVKLCSNNGLLIFTTWQFLDLERLRKRVLDLLDPENQIKIAEFDLVPSDLEEGDYILDWVKGEYAIRYAHYFPVLEVEKMCLQAGYYIHTLFSSDGHLQNRNRYYLCTK